MSSTKKRIIAIVVFFAVNCLLSLRHEMWFDEARCWLLAKSMTPDNLTVILSNEGHPVLWYLVLMPFAKLGVPYEFAKIIPLLIMLVAAVIFMFKCPIKEYLKVLILFSPMFIYYYPIFVRSYCLSALLMIIAASLFSGRREHPFAMAISLALLIQTHLHVIGFCFGVCVVIVIEAVCGLIRKTGDKKILTKQLISLLIPLLSALSLFWEFKGVWDNPLLGEMKNTDMDPVFSMFAQLDYLMGLLWVIFVPALILFILLLVRNEKDGRWQVLSVFAVSFMELAGIGGMNSIYDSPNNGYMLIAFALIFSFWQIAEITEKSESKYIRICSVSVIAVLFAGMWISSAVTPVEDMFMMYSDAKNTAEKIEELPDEITVVKVCQYPMDSMIPYLDDETRLKAVSEHRLEDVVDSYGLMEFREVYNGYGSVSDAVRDRFSGTEEIYIVYPLAVYPNSYSNISYIVGNYEYEEIYRTSGDVMFDGRESFGIVKVNFARQVNQ